MSPYHSAQTPEWISLRPPLVPPRLRLFCLPHAGGGTAVYHRWAAALAPEVQVCPLCLPGRETLLRLPPFTRIAPLVDVLVNILAPTLAFPYALFGHSMGALLAFEVAREIRRRNLPAPLGLLVAGHRAPHLPREDPPVHRLPEPQLVLAMQSRYGGIPAPILADAESLRVFIPALRADMELVETAPYIEDAPLDIPIIACAGTESPEGLPGELEAWERHSRVRFRAHRMTGGHFFLHDAPGPFVSWLRGELGLLLNREQGLRA